MERAIGQSVMSVRSERAFESSSFVFSRKMTKVFGIFRRSILTLGISFGLGSIGYAHSGIVDGYGCHRAADKVTYHCHQGQFAGRTFKSKEDFLRQLRGGKSEQLSPKSNPPQIERKIEE